MRQPERFQMKRWMLGALLLGATPSFADLTIDMGSAFRVPDGAALVVRGTTTLVAGSFTLANSSFTTDNVRLTGGVFTAGASQIAVMGDWTRTAGTFTSGTSTVSFSGAAGSTSTITGNSSFTNFQSTVPAKTLLFQSGSTTTVTGMFRLQGVVGQVIRVRASASPSQAYLINSGTNSVTYTNPQDNNAGGGLAILTTNSTNGGNTVNWFFGGASGSGKPLPPGGILGTYNASNQFTLAWHAVTLDTIGSPISISNYRVERSTQIATVVQSSVTYASTILSAVDATAPTQFFRVIAISTAGVESDPTDYVDSSLFNQFRYALDSGNFTNRLLAPSVIAKELRYENNSLQQDLDIRIDRVSANENATVLGSYDVYAVYHNTPTVRVSHFNFSAAQAQMTLGYTASPGALVQLFWNDGIASIPLTAPASADGTPITVTVRTLGTYEIRVVQAASATGFRVLDGFPRPRVINPKSTQNRRIFWAFNNPDGERVIAKIYDIRGGLIRNVTTDTSTQPDMLAWDGKSDSGEYVPSGVYLYKLEAGKTVVTGTVVVAR